jgi:hypothetical protein
MTHHKAPALDPTVAIGEPSRRRRHRRPHCSRPTATLARADSDTSDPRKEPTTIRITTHRRLAGATLPPLAVLVVSAITNPLWRSVLPLVRCLAGRRATNLMARLAGATAVGIALLVAGPPVAAQAAPPSTPCDNLGYQRVTGGDNLFASNPGNVTSPDWVRMYGDQATFRVPINPTVRTDCYGAAAGILLRMRMVNSSGDLTNSIAIVGVLFENRATTHGFVYADPVFGSAFYTSTPPAIEDNWSEIFSGSIVAADCHLGAGGLVTLRIKAFTDGAGNNAWRPQCKAGSQWLDMYQGTSYVDNAHHFGVDLMERFRAGSVGGLVIDATGLQEMTVTGAWTNWENSDCFQNSTSGSDTYRFASVSRSEFTIDHGTPNPNC